MELKITNQGDYSGLSGWAQCSSNKGPEKEKREAEEEFRMMCIRAATVAGFEGRGKGHKPRNVGRLPKLGKDIPRAPRKEYSPMN